MRRVLRWLTMCMVMVALVVTTSVTWAFAEQQVRTPSHAIAIAYDNSGSMYFAQTEPYPPIDRWSNAKYSLEVLAAMLNETDELKVFTMDQSDVKVTIEGSRSMEERVSAIHSVDLGSTDYTSVDPSRNALSYLQASNADEKHLIIMTDGEFGWDRGEGVTKEEGLTRITSVAEAAHSSGITTTYIAIGDDALAIEEQPDKDIYSKRTNSETIPDTMIEVANQVFGRANLPNEYWNAKTGDMTFDIPMSKIVVLAQGDGVKLGSLSNDAGSVPVEKASVSCSAIGDAEKSSIINEHLHGQVGIYDKPMQAGSYHLDVSGAEAVAVYYMPYVDIATELANAEGGVMRLTPGSSNSIVAGDFSTSVSLLDPFTGEPLTSKLLEGATYTLDITQNGQTQSVVPGDAVHLEPGVATFRATADVAGGVRVVQQYDDVEIKAPLEGLDLNVSEVPRAVRYDRPNTAESNPEGKVIATKTNGEPITAEEWAIMELTAQGTRGLSWTIEKTQDPGVFTVKVESSGNKPGIFDWLSIHLFPHLTGGATRTTRFACEVRSTESNLGGEATAKTALVGTFMWWIWAIIATLLAIITRWLTKPRLPELVPYIDLDDGHGPRKIRGSVIKDSSFFSLLPERGHFMLSVNGKKDSVVRGILGIDRIDLVATGGSRKRTCQVAPATAQILHRLNKEQPVKAECRAVDAQGNPVTLTEGYVMRLKRLVDEEQRRCKIHMRYRPK